MAATASTSSATRTYANDNTPVYLTKAQLEDLVIKIVKAAKGS